MPSYDLRAHQERTEEESVGGVSTRPDPAVTLSQELERLYRERQYDWATQAQKLSEFFHNAQFTAEQVEKLGRRGQAAVPINVIYPATEQAVSMLTTNKPRFQATAREDSDTKTAKVIADLMSWIWDHSKGNVHLKQAVYDYYVKGRGVLMAYMDPYEDFGRGEVMLTCVDPLDVYPDPNSKDRYWRDASHVVVSRVFTREQIEAMWPNVVEMGLMQRASASEPDNIYTGGMMKQQGQHVGAAVDRDPHHERYKVIERYTKVKVDYKHCLDQTTGIEKVYLPEEYREMLQEPAAYIDAGQGGQYITRPSEVEEVMALYEQGQPVDGEEGARVYDAPPQEDPQTGQVIDPPPITIVPLTKLDLVEAGIIACRSVLLDRIQLVISIGGALYYNDFLPISEYPLVPLNNRHDRNPYPMSDVSFVQPMQESLNKLHMQIVANLATGNNQKIIVPRGSVDRKQIEKELTRAGAAVIEVDYDMGEPKVVGPSPMPAGLFQHFQVLTQMIERELGIFSLMQGDPAAAPSTYKGTLAMDEFGQRRIRSKLDDIEGSIMQLGKVCVEMIQHVYTEEKVIRLVQPNGDLAQSTANQPIYDDFGAVIERVNDVSAGSYDLIVVAGSTLPSSRWALMEYYMELANVVGPAMIPEILKKSEIPNWEGIWENVNLINQQQQVIEQLEQEVKELRGDLQTAERAEVNSRKRVEVEKFKTKLGTASSKAQQATSLYEARLKDQLQLRRKENKE